MSLLGAAMLIGFYSARATTSQAQQSQLGPARVAYDCDTGAGFTLTRQGNSDRYTYDGVNTRGETLRIPNGTSYADGSARVRVYTFTTGDTRFLVEAQDNGRATLSTSQGGGNYTTFNCTVASNNSGTPVVPGLW